MSDIPQSRLRNFSIIAHIDHGKSTLADRLLEATHTVDPRQMTSQMLDSMDLEREKGITIKARAVRLEYVAADGLNYGLNLIDTPGHVDFAYEVSRSLQACDGAILVVDASQGIEAQTLANVHLAMKMGLVIIPVLNKIDLPASDPEAVMNELEETLAIPREEVILASAKEGKGIPEILEALVKRIPAPSGPLDAPLKALVFDSHYDTYKGVVNYIRVQEGRLKMGEAITMMGSGAQCVPVELGYFRPQHVPVQELQAGEVGYIATGLKSVRDARVGDTVTTTLNPATVPLPGYQVALPLVFAGLYPLSGDEYPALREALEKLHLNDASFTFEAESSAALGFGFRCGFLGLLHMDIVQERLEREYGMSLITTAPTVVYQVALRDGTVMEIENPSRLPDVSQIAEIREPMITASILVPGDYVGPVMTLCTEKRGAQKNMQYLGRQVMLTYELPLNEVVMDFFDRLKSVSRGYASLDYDFLEYRAGDLVRLDILINNERVDALSLIVHRANAQYRGRDVAERMRKLIPRQMFDIAIQAAIGAHIIARETVKAMRKNVLAKCYGGDITRRKKLLEKQKAGKKRMKQVGTVEIPQEAFLAILQVDK